MTRLKALEPEQAVGKTKDLFEAINGSLGMVPNMMRTMGNSSHFLQGYLNLSGALGNGSLGSKTGGLIAMVTAETNQCNYCLSAHTYIGINLLKLDKEALEAAREANSSNPKIDSILKFARALVIKRGHVTDEDMQALKTSGVTEGEVAEIVGHVALNVLTNYFNNTANTEIDFPVVEAVSEVHI